jgi:hypothetical protein
MSHRRPRRRTEEREQPLNDDERRRLGLGAQITRRDFVNGILVGAGGALMSAPSFAAKSQKPKLDTPEDTLPAANAYCYSRIMRCPAARRARMSS